MAVVDTSFLVALHFSGDRFHRAASTVDLAGDRFLVPAEIWAEYADVLLRLAPPGRVGKLLESTLSGPFEVQAVFKAHDYGALALKASKARDALRRLKGAPLSFFDVVVCAAAERYREPVLTFDKAIQAAIRAKVFPGARLAKDPAHRLAGDRGRGGF